MLCASVYLLWLVDLPSETTSTFMLIGFSSSFPCSLSVFADGIRQRTCLALRGYNLSRMRTLEALDGVYNARRRVRQLSALLALAQL